MLVLTSRLAVFGTPKMASREEPARSAGIWRVHTLQSPLPLLIVRADPRVRPLRPLAHVAVIQPARITQRRRRLEAGEPPQEIAQREEELRHGPSARAGLRHGLATREHLDPLRVHQPRHGGVADVAGDVGAQLDAVDADLIAGEHVEVVAARAALDLGDVTLAPAQHVRARLPGQRALLDPAARHEAAAVEVVVLRDLVEGLLAR